MTGYQLFKAPERRLANFNNSYSSLEELPLGATQHVIGITASDGGASVGVLHQPAGGARICVVYMHPRTNQTRPYLAPAFLKEKIAVWGQLSRHVNNDTDMTHEEVLLDLAAGMRWLRANGFDTLIAIGNSGGSSLAAYYQSQASRAPADRQLMSPAGERTGFDKEEMPPYDLFVALALHIGEGSLLLRMLDPAVLDEGNPIATDPSLDMFNPRNGYLDFPEQSQYSTEWLQRYRDAQVERCRRLDGIARSMLDDYHDARQLANPKQLEAPIARQAMYARYMIVHRTWANPADLDLSLEPNRRPVGILGAEHPIRANLGYHGPSRVITPRAWLSTWSGLSSRAELIESVRHVKIPTLFIWPDADLFSYERDIDELMAASVAKDKQVAVVEWGTHYLTPASDMPKGMAHPKQRAGEIVLRWITDQLGQRSRAVTT